ncbi:hypothetical protein C8Q74DRAFT_321082 [Fomes fomentarius]|nr:hypothetical protein C8Q74DRAFT_321082 [Fomes fomentarius]
MQRQSPPKTPDISHSSSYAAGPPYDAVQQLPLDNGNSISNELLSPLLSLAISPTTETSRYLLYPSSSDNNTGTMASTAQQRSLQETPTDIGVGADYALGLHAHLRSHPDVPRRVPWVHAMEKDIFSPDELMTMSRRERREIYTASLESHADQLIDQLRQASVEVVSGQDVAAYRGINRKTLKSLAAGMHHDAVNITLEIVQLQHPSAGRAAENAVWWGGTGHRCLG